jgi:hypothetical protein
MTSRRAILFALANVFVFVCFSVLYACQFHMPDPISEKIDRIAIPWGWMVCFFVASFSTLPGLTVKSAFISLCSSLGFTVILYFFDCMVLRLIFDPWM